MSKIIVGVDGSERGKDAVALAAQLATGSGAELVLVNAYPYEDFPSRVAATGYRQYLREDAEEAIRRSREGIAGLPEVAERTVADLSPARGIQTMAVHEGASLIVIGSSHRSGVGRVLAGTTAERLLHGAPCPVAVAPKGFHNDEPRPIVTIGVAYNASEEAKAALVGATALARSLGATLRVIDVLDLGWYGTPAAMQGPGYIAKPDDLVERARTHLAEDIAKLPKGIVAEPVVAVGDAEGLLAAQSALVDLMVVGSRGYGPLRAVLIGSVSGRLVRDSACPVLVVPRGIEAPLEELFGAMPAERTSVG
jgi:nucleotide-binding universal stress UspA family protein